MKIHLKSTTGLTSRISNYLTLAGFTVTTDPVDFDFVLTEFDKASESAQKIAQAAGKYYPPASFIDKEKLTAHCLAAGLPVLPTMNVNRLMECTYAHFIIKPKVFSGGKSPLPWVYKIFRNDEKLKVQSLIGDASTDTYFIQQALIDPATRETYLLFVDGAVNGKGEIHFNSIADKYMKDPVELDSFITHRVGIREVSQADKYKFKEQITSLIAFNNVKNTPFKAQAIVDVNKNVCYINDWSWGVMPYTHLYLLDHTYLKSALEFAYDVTPIVTKPIDKPIIMNHIAFPASVYDLSEEAFDVKYAQLAAMFGVVRVEANKQFATIKPTNNQYVLYGIAADTVDLGRFMLTQFQQKVNELG